MEDLQIAINEKLRLIHEDEDKFIFEAIRTYSDGVFAHEGILKIPKKLLERALTCFRSEHPGEFMYLLKDDEKKGCSNCKFWGLDKNDENRRCQYCFNQDEWQAEREEQE